MKRTGLFCRLMIGVIACGCVMQGLSETMDSRLEAYFREYLEAWFRQQPLAATQLGDHRFDDRLDDVSPRARREWIALSRLTLEGLPRQVKFEELSRPGQVDYDIFRQHLKRSLWLEENIRRFETDPRVYNEYISDAVFLLLSQSSLPKEQNLANCLARMEQIPQVVAAAKLSLSNPPRAVLETAIRQNEGSIGFYEKDIFELAGKTPRLQELKASAARVVLTLKDYGRYLKEDLLPRATGEWRLGRETFSQKLELELDAGLSAGQVLAEAETEFDRVSREMQVIARQLWSSYYPKAPVPADDAAGRREMVARVLERIGQDHCTPQKLVSEVRDTVAAVKEFIRSREILALPSPDSCRIIEMPEFQRGNSTAYMNSPPPLDPKAKGFYAVSPPPREWDAQRVESYLQEYNRYMLQILTIHEAYPGHYVQFEYANRNPSLIRKVLASGVYVEGWAVYTEQTLLDQGYGDGDLALRLTQLKFYLRAVANAILDHKMHCTGMTDEEALNLLTVGAFQSEGEAKLKIVRAKQSSVQLSTYFVGRMAHYRLRQAIQRELGTRFSLARYHEGVLAEGAVPVKVLPELVKARLCR